MVDESSRGGIDPSAGAAGACLLDRSGHVCFCDQGARRIVGPLPIGLPLQQSVPWAPAAFEEPGYREGVLQQRRVRITWTPVTETPGVDGVSAVVVFEDRQGSFESEAALRVAHETLRSLVDACPVGVATLDVDMQVTRWNPAAEEISGWASAEVLGNPYPLVPPAEWPSFVALFERVMAGEGFAGVEGRRARKDGSDLDLRIHTAPMRDPSGRVVGALALLEDLSERRKLEERVRHAQTMEAVGRLAGGVAHDFNNMLAVILGISEVLLLRPETLQADRERALREIIACAERARKLTAQLLAFSRRQVLRPEVNDLRELVGNARSLLQSVLGEEVSLLVSAPREDAEARVCVDTNQFDQLLVNLAANARAAMPAGGTFTLRVEAPVRVAQPGAHELSAAPGEFAVLVVEDDGTGIPDDALPHIFDPFFTTKADGTGLGLASVYGVVQQSGGFIEAASELGHGTSFRLHFPLVAPLPEETPAQEEERQHVPLLRGNEHILVVEDEACVRQVTATMLESLGYRVTTAVDGVDALAQFAAEHAHPVDLVLTDLSMPRLGGLLLADELARTQPGLPVVFMSAHLDLPDLRARVEAGEAHFVQKPASRDQLAELMRRAFGEQARDTVPLGQER